MKKKMKVMILCTGIKGVGAYDGEFVIHLLPKEYHPPELMAVAARDEVVVLMDHQKTLYAATTLGPFSYSLCETMDCNPDLLRIARCLAMLGMFTQAQLDARMEELDEIAEAKSDLGIAEESIKLLGKFGVTLTVKQIRKIRKALA